MGNHVHRILKEYTKQGLGPLTSTLHTICHGLQSANTEVLCSSLVAVAEQKCSTLPEQLAPSLSMLLWQGVSEEDIDKLGTYTY